jgi:hypothetical protein
MALYNRLCPLDFAQKTTKTSKDVVLNISCEKKVCCVPPGALVPNRSIQFLCDSQSTQSPTAELPPSAVTLTVLFSKLNFSCFFVRHEGNNNNPTRSYQRTVINLIKPDKSATTMWYLAFVRFIRRRLVLAIIFVLSLTYCISKLQLAKVRN